MMGRGWAWGKAGWVSGRQGNKGTRGGTTGQGDRGAANGKRRTRRTPPHLFSAPSAMGAPRSRSIGAAAPATSSEATLKPTPARSALMMGTSPGAAAGGKRNSSRSFTASAASAARCCARSAGGSPLNAGDSSRHPHELAGQANTTTRILRPSQFQILPSHVAGVRSTVTKERCKGQSFRWLRHDQQGARYSRAHPRRSALSHGNLGTGRSPIAGDQDRCRPVCVDDAARGRAFLWEWGTVPDLHTLHSDLPTAVARKL